MKGKALLFSLCCVVVFTFSLLALTGMIFAQNSATLLNPASGNVTVSVNHVYINVSSNETIAANGSTIISWWNQSGANINITGNSTGAIVANATGPGAPADLANYTAFNFTNLNDGVHRFSVILYSNDSSSTSSDFLNLTMNVTVAVHAAHTATLVSPAISNLTNLSVAYVFLNVSSNETIRTNTSTYVSWWNQTGANVNFTDMTVSNGTAAHSVWRNMTNLGDGVHRFIVYVYSNNTMKTNMTSANVTVDTTAPSVTAVPWNGSSPLTTEDNTPQINVTASDSQLNGSSINISLQFFVDRAVNTQDTILNGTAASFNLSALTNGNHSVQVEAADAMGHRTNSSAMIMNVDSIGAAIVIAQPNLSATTLGQLIFPGNTTKNYTVGIRFNISESTLLTNVTFFLPYGFTPSTGVSVCNGGGSLRSTGKHNVTHVSCALFFGNMTVNNGTAINLTVTANYSAMSQYNTSFAFEARVSCGNLLGCPTANLTWNMSAAPYAINPRPDASITAGDNVSITFTNWNQTDPGLRVQTPIYTFDPTLGRPVLANNTYGELLYFDKSFFEEPSFMRLWSYNLTFRVIFTGPANATNITIRSPVNNSADIVQSLVPLLIMTTETQDHRTNSTRNFTMATPNPSGFTVYWNGTNYSSSALLGATGINLALPSASGTIDQTVALLTLTIPNDTIAERLNNTDLSVLFTLANLTACGSAPCSVSPIYVNTQQISGWSHDSPPQFGSSLNISYIVNATNRLTNYTLSNLSISIMQPMNVTITVGSTVSQFNMTRNVNISVWNGSRYIENLSVVRRESNFTFTEAMGPGAGATVSLYVTTFDVQLDSADAYNATWRWDPNRNGTVVINFSAEMQFPVLNESSLPSGDANASYTYNATLNMPQRAPLNLSSKLAGVNTANCGSTGSSCSLNVTVDGVQVAAANITIGSLILDDVTSGQHVVMVTYTIPAAAATTTTTPGGGSTPTVGTEATTTFSSIAAGLTNTMLMSKSGLPMKKIDFVTSDSATNVKLTVKTASQPSGVSSPGTVFAWINVTHTNLNDSDIQSAVLYFNVTKSWLTTHSLQQNEVYLQRYTTASGWALLDTTRLGESATEVAYRATSPGLSFFAITGVASTTPPAGEPICGNNVREGSEACDGSDLAGSSCEAQGFDQGTLRCANNCVFDTVDCSNVAPEEPGPGGEEEPLPADYTGIALVIMIAVIIVVGGYWYYHVSRRKE